MAWFGLVERQAVRRAVPASVKDLNTSLRAHVDGWNKRAHPFTWTKTAEQVLAKANRPTTSNPHHYLPPYAPDHNPTEHVWNAAKSSIANIQKDTPEETSTAFINYINNRTFNYNLEHLPTTIPKNHLV